MANTLTTPPETTKKKYSFLSSALGDIGMNDSFVLPIKSKEQTSKYFPSFGTFWLEELLHTLKLLILLSPGSKKT